MGKSQILTANLCVCDAQKETDLLKVTVHHMTLSLRKRPGYLRRQKNNTSGVRQSLSFLNSANLVLFISFSRRGKGNS